jgi:hypothetical protein
MDAEPNDPARKLIHYHQDPVGPECCRFAPEQIHAPDAVFHVAQERQPGGTTRVLSRPIVTGENSPNHVFVDLNVERQGDLLCDSRRTPVGITLLHFDDRMNEFWARSFRAGIPRAIRREQHAVLSLARWLAVSKASVRLRNGADELDAPKAPSSPRIRSHADRLGDRCRERFTIRSWCFRRSDSATRERTPPSPSRRTRVARKWMKRTTRWRIEEW